MEQSGPVSTPIDPKSYLHKATDDELPVDQNLYQQIISVLIYLVTCTHPDLAFCISYLSQFSSCPLNFHHTAVKRVFRYISGTRSYVLIYPRSGSVKLEGFLDASFANCLDTRRSYTGYVFQLEKCTISWYSKKQQCISNSTTEAEYIALSMTARQAKWYTHAFKQFNINIPVQLYYNN